jgi:hypothetical protein
MQRANRGVRIIADPGYTGDLLLFHVDRDVDPDAPQEGHA